jgi:ribosomal protein S18 acetylase RimI-like enzyme
MLKIERVTQITIEILQAMVRLVPQLTSINPPPTPDELESMLKSDCSMLFVARDEKYGEAETGGRIIGMATLVLYRVPTGLRAYIEDVVVESRARGHGIGESLTYACMEQARKAGAPAIGLTSNPGRLAANHLYQKMGFELRQTNVYRYMFKKGRREGADT